MSQSNKRFYIEADDMEVGGYVVPVDNANHPCNGCPFKILAIDFPFMIAEPVYKNVLNMTFDVRILKFKRTTEEYLKVYQDMENKYQEYQKNAPKSINTLGDFITGFKSGDNISYGNNTPSSYDDYNGEQNPND